MRQIVATARKELSGYFGSPMALIFIGAFLAAALFTFFWVDTFFARGVADVRPLFRWMPLLTMFLVAALTMRQWSEEQHSGTLEILLTLPVSPLKLVLGKFLAVLALVSVALALTIFLPITVALLGDLDWGPVIGGYLASVLLASAYAAIGLFVSSRTNNQIVSLILSVLVCGVFYLVGSAGVTDFVGGSAGAILRAIGSGSRFTSIERGVIDLRDLAYYLSLSGVFLALNVASINAVRWGAGPRTQPTRRAVVLTTALVVANLILVNVWLYPLARLRVDLTGQREYTLSPATRDLLDGLQEPLLVRGYFSERTHPLLAPLVPRVGDMLREYQLASRGKMELDLIDPAKAPELEAEANQVYGIRPTPFQVSGRYEESIINSYFSILIQYGDQNAVLGFGDLIEVEPRRDGTVDVQLRNLEYDLTSAIRKTVYGFQSVDAVLAALSEPARLTLYVTQATLPADLAEVPATIERVSTEISTESGGKFEFSTVDPDQPGSPTSRQDLYELYGLQPLAVSFFSEESYLLYMVLNAGDQAEVIYPSGASEADIRGAIESGLKRGSTGFLQVVALWTPPDEPAVDEYGQQQAPISSWNELYGALRQEYEVRVADLTSGQVETDVDVLVLVAPQGMTDVERFAVDQYLMRGGAVVVAAGNFALTVDQYVGGLGLKPLEGGLREMLASYGIDIEQSLVLDPQNEPFPVTVNRSVGDLQVQELQAMDYPFFVDVRPDGMSGDNAIVSNLPAVTMNWSSPLRVDEATDAAMQVDVLLKSSDESWTQVNTLIQPDFELYPEAGFPVSQQRQSSVLGVAVQGVFGSFFSGQPSPLDQTAGEAGDGAPAQMGPRPARIDVSPGTSRLVVLGSAEFVDDIVLEISSQLGADRYLNSLRLVQNAVAWATEDADLLAIRARGTSTRVLAPLAEGAQTVWETANYVMALLALAGVGAYWAARRRNEEPMDLVPREDLGAAVGEVLQ